MYHFKELLNNEVCSLQWRDRLGGALRKMNVGGLVEQAITHVSKTNGSVEDMLDDSPVIKLFLHFLFPILLY